MLIEIGYELEDKIVISSLTEYRNRIAVDLAKYKSDPDTNWLHPDDIEHIQEMIVHLDAVLGDYGA